MTTSPFSIFTQQVRRYFSGSLFHWSRTLSSSSVGGSRFSMPEAISTTQVPQEQLKQPASISTPASSPASRRRVPAGTSADWPPGRRVTLGMVATSERRGGLIYRIYDGPQDTN